MDAHKYLYQFGNSKEEIETFTNQILDEINNGNVEPYKFQGIAHQLVKGLQLALEANMTNLDTFNKHEEFGFKFTPKEAGARYDFSACNHPMLAKLAPVKAEIEAQIKEVEKFVKALSQPVTLVDDESGEVVTVYPAVKKSKTIIEIR